MSAELQWSYETGKSCYCVMRNTTGQPWSTSGGTGGFSAFLSGAWPDYAVAGTEQGVTGYYTADMPAAMPAGVLNVVAKEQLGGTEAQTDPTIANGDVQWNGSAVLPLSNLATSGQIGQIAPLRVARGTMVQNFPIYLKSSADHITPFTSGVVSGQISRDGGAFGVLQSGAFSEVGQGVFSLQALTSGDLLANTCTLLFTANGISGGSADPLAMSFVLQRTSGQ